MPTGRGEEAPRIRVPIPTCPRLITPGREIRSQAVHMVAQASDKVIKFEISERALAPSSPRINRAGKLRGRDDERPSEPAHVVRRSRGSLEGGRRHPARAGRAEPWPPTGPTWHRRSTTWAIFYRATHRFADAEAADVEAAGIRREM